MPSKAFSSHVVKKVKKDKFKRFMCERMKEGERLERIQAIVDEVDPYESY
jgi:hypothetical protein